MVHIFHHHMSPLAHDDSVPMPAAEADSLVGGTSTTLLRIVFSISVFSRLKFLREQRGAECCSLNSNRRGTFRRRATYLQLECVGCEDYFNRKLVDFRQLICSPSLHTRSPTLAVVDNVISKKSFRCPFVFNYYS